MLQLTSHAGSHFEGPMCDTMIQEGHSMMIYPTLPHVSVTKHEILDCKLTGSLEEGCEVVQFITEEFEILLHARDVGVVLGDPSDTSHRDKRRWIIRYLFDRCI